MIAVVVDDRTLRVLRRFTSLCDAETFAKKRAARGRGSFIVKPNGMRCVRAKRSRSAGQRFTSRAATSVR